tara:strand:+ start:1756 stop:2889 length:1134 start_codon:yes stop_codon:yes gene_type:complete
MQQNIKGLLLLIFLIVFSFVSFQYFNNDDAGTVSVPSTTSTTTTTIAVVEIEPYNAPAFNLEEIISSSLEKIDIVCERTGNWFSLTSTCLEQWNNAYITITENKALYSEHYEYSRKYFIENYKYLEEDDLEVIISSLAINEKLNFFVNELTEVSEVLEIKKDSMQNSTSIFLSDDAIQDAKSIGTEDLLGGCYLDVENSPSDNEWVEVPSGNTKDSSKFNYGIKIESSLNLDSNCIKNLLFLILNDEKGWINITDKSFHQTSIEESDFVYIFATPEKTDELCYPLETNGIFSCRNEKEIVINNFRWENGATDFLKDIEMYRLYLINHETGHILGWGHTDCPKEGAIAPLMMQQSKGTNGCIPYGWPAYEVVKSKFDY